MALLERETELAELHRALSDAGGGRGRTVLVCGEAGIGKTALVNAFTHTVGERARVLRGVCEALFTPRPLGPFYDIVYGLGGPLRAQLESGAKHVDVFHGLLDSIRTHERPSVVVLEDMHWADHATLDFVRFVARRIPHLPAVLLSTYRDDEVGADHPLTAVLGEIPPGDQIHLKLPVFSRATVDHLAREAGRAENNVYRVTGGNPFFVTELLSAGGNTETLAPNVRQAVLSRARHLSPSAREVLDLVSVVPDKLELSLLEGPLATDLSALEECAARGLLAFTNEHASFRHELARLAIESALSPVKLTRLNRRVVEALAKTALNGKSLTRLAHHAVAAHDSESIVRFAPQAATIATERGANREAAALLTGALPHADRLPLAERAALFDQRAQACFVVDESLEGIAMSEAAYALWDALGDDLAKGRNLVRRCDILYDADITRRDELLAHANQAIGLLEPHGPSAELASAMCWAGMMLCRRDLERSHAYLIRATRMAESLTNLSSVIAVLARLHVLEMFLLGAPSELGIAKLLALSKAHGSDRGILNAFRSAAFAAAPNHDLPRLERAITEGLRFAEERQLELYIPAFILRTHLLELDHHRGQWEALTRNAERHLGSGRSPRSVPVFMDRLRAGAMFVRAGRSEAIQWLRDALAMESHLMTFEAFSVHCALAEHHWLSGDRDATRQSARNIRDVRYAVAHPWIRGEGDFWLWVVEELDGVAPHTAEPYALQFAGDWRGAAHAWKRLGYVYMEGLSLLFGDEAAQREALEIFERLGADAAADCCRRRMHEQGIRNIPRGAYAHARTHPLGLTEREAEVLALLAEGQSNAEIAKRLVRSVRTVDHHVAGVIAKLGARSRQEAVAVARKRGWLGG